MQTDTQRQTDVWATCRASRWGRSPGRTDPSLLRTGLGWGLQTPTRKSPGVLSGPPWGMGGFSPGLWSQGGDGRVEGRGAVTTGGRGEARDPLSLSKEAHGLSLDPKGACGSVELSAASPPQLTALGNDAGVETGAAPQRQPSPCGHGWAPQSTEQARVLPSAPSL